MSQEAQVEKSPHALKKNHQYVILSTAKNDMSSPVLKVVYVHEHYTRRECI